MREEQNGRGEESREDNGKEIKLAPGRDGMGNKKIILIKRDRVRKRDRKEKKIGDKYIDKGMKAGRMETKIVAERRIEKNEDTVINKQKD